MIFGIDVLGVAVPFLIVGAIVLLALIFRPRRVIVSSSLAMEVYGLGKPQYVTGSARFILPLVQKKRFLNLSMMTVKVPDDSVRDVNGVPLVLDWSWQGGLIADPVALTKSFVKFGDYANDDHNDVDIDAVNEAIKTTLSHAFRTVCGTMTIQEIHRSREKFTEAVKVNIQDELERMGVETDSMGVAEVKDPDGYLEALARPEIAAVKRDADINESKAKQAADQARIRAETEVLQQQEELDMRKVAKDRKVGLAEAEKNRDVQEAHAAAVEKQMRAEKIIPAEAEAQATKIEADANKIRTVVEAEARSDAVRAEAAASAESTRVRGQAEAASTEAKLLAEAKGKEELAKAASAEGRVNLDVLRIEKAAQVQTDVGRELAAALGKIGDNVTVTQIGGGDSSGGGVEKVVMDFLRVFAGAKQTLSDLYGEKTINDAFDKVTETVEEAVTSVAEKVVKDKK